ncbi:MAG: hypothetical protein ACTSU5_13825 [Promethearchaeota archaeon]
MDFLIVAAVILVSSIFLAGYFLAKESSRDAADRVTTWLARTSAGFMLAFMPVYWFYEPARAANIGLTPAPEGVLDVLTGVSLVCLFTFAFLVAPYRIAGVTSALSFTLWYVEEPQWMLRNMDRLSVVHVGTLAFVLSVTVVMVLALGSSIARAVLGTLELRKDGKSALLGPWFSNVFGLKNWKRLDAGKRRAVKRGALACALLGAVALPGILPFFHVPRVPITIRPRTDYDIRFNFWASNNINADYTPAMIRELDEHRANLDFGVSMNEKGVKTLRDFEFEMPHVTYRTTVTPTNFSQLDETVRGYSELLLPYLQNGTLDQWRGFAFDIEGDAFRWWLGFDTVDEAVAEWNRTFDYVDSISAQLGWEVEMENVGSHVFASDVKFDGDLDVQTIEGYRCMTDFDACEERPAVQLEPWRTSYSVYTAMYTLNQTVGVDRVGIYLGITNCTCYSRDLPQTEPVTWGEATGLGNLVRDSLIAKSFGAREVTYFLAWSLPWTAGSTPSLGAFDSYGDDFLDVMDEAVNVNPPEEFTIYYDHLDADYNREMFRDILGDISRPAGLAMALVAVAAAISGTALAERLLPWEKLKYHRGKQ